MPASYLSIVLSGVTTGTIFKDVAITFSDVSFLSTSKAWAGTSADGFANATTLKFNQQKSTKDVMVNLPSFTYDRGEPLELRVYGLIGSDKGSFNSVSLTGGTLALVPEPDIRMLLTAAGLAALVSFRHRRHAPPRSHRWMATAGSPDSLPKLHCPAHPAGPLVRFCRETDGSVIAGV